MQQGEQGEQTHSLKYGAVILSNGEISASLKYVQVDIKIVIDLTQQVVIKLKDVEKKLQKVDKFIEYHTDAQDPFKKCLQQVRELIGPDLTPSTKVEEILKQNIEFIRGIEEEARKIQEVKARQTGGGEPPKEDVGDWCGGTIGDWCGGTILRGSEISELLERAQAQTKIMFSMQGLVNTELKSAQKKLGGVAALARRLAPSLKDPYEISVKELGGLISMDLTPGAKVAILEKNIKSIRRAESDMRERLARIIEEGKAGKTKGGQGKRPRTPEEGGGGKQARAFGPDLGKDDTASSPCHLSSKREHCNGS